MNLLAERWIPVRLLPSGGAQKISLKELLCGDGKWELCLPRDDMELAALQLLICITQVVLTPKDAAELKQHIARPVSEDAYDSAAKLVDDWFRLDHPKYPFMQTRGIKADKVIPMDGLLAGLSGATSSCFVNQAGLGERICGGCAAIALFNQASCAPSFGGGFKAGLRGPSPVTTLVQGQHLRQTVWLNVLCEERLSGFIAWYDKTRSQKPTWVVPIEKGKTILPETIGVVRGLLWQPAHVELLSPKASEPCSCCGSSSEPTYHGFTRAKFSYTLDGTWPHPHSPRVAVTKDGKVEEKFVAFRTSAPSWTQLSRFVVQQQVDDGKDGQQPAAVILQVRQLFGEKAGELHLLVGGYRNKQASILERRHEVYTLNHGWDRNTDVIDHLVAQGGGYRDALYKALYVFVSGIKDVKGAGIKLHQAAEPRFYRRSEPTILETLARIDFDNPIPELVRMRAELKRIVEDLFEESVRPYLQDPELFRTLAVARKTLNKHLRRLEPQQDSGGKNGTATA